MTTARDKFVAWLGRAAGKKARAMPGTLGLEAAFRAGWTAATRKEREAARSTILLLTNQLARLKKGFP